MSARRKGALALLVGSMVMLQAALLLPTATTAAASDGGYRMPTGNLIVFQDDFSSGTIDTSKWVHWTGNWSVDDIAWTPTGGIYTSDNDYLTESAYNNGHNGVYLPNETVMIETTWIDLSNLTTPRLEFKQMYDIPSPGDGGLIYVWASTTEAWAIGEPDGGYPEGSSTGYTGQLLTWETVAVRLDQYAGARVRVGFYFKSTPGNVQGDGWMIDDIQVGGRASTPLPDLKFGNTNLYVGGYPVTSTPAGSVVEVNASILNEGHSNAAPFEVTFYTGNPFAGGELIGRSVALDGLPVGGTMYVSMRWVASPGHFKPFLFIDAPNQVPEENELNNVRTLGLDVAEPSSGDAGVDSMHFEVAGKTVQGAGVGDLITMVVRVRNFGQSPVTTPMALRAYDGDPAKGGKLVGDEQPLINALEPGRNRTFLIHWRPLSGNHTLHVGLWPIDPDIPLDDNAANNATTGTLVVTDSPPVNLVAQSLQFIVSGRPSTACFEGQDVHIRATVANMGQGAYEGAVDVAVFDGDPDSGGRELGRKAVIGTLDPSATATVEMDWRGELGSHALSVFVDPDNLVFESNEEDNQHISAITVTRAPLPDLVISSMRLMLNGEPIDPNAGTSEGAQVEVNISVRNIGNEETKAQTVTTLYLGNPALGGKAVGSFNVHDGLNVDDVFTASITWTATRPAQKSQTPVLFVVADSDDREREIDKLNNFDMRALKVGDKMPDLKVTGLRVLLANGTAVERITYGIGVRLEVAVRNVGTEIVFQAASIEFYLDTTDQSALIGSSSISTLDVGESSTKSIAWMPDAIKVGGGAHTIIAWVDPSREIPEASDANNVGTAPLYIDADARPNLLLGNYEVLLHGKVVDRVTRGDRVTVRLMVLNLGQAPLYTPTDVELAQGQSGTPVTWPLLSLAVGANKTYEVNWTLDSGEPLVVRIDPTNKVRETNELDNTVSIPIDVAAPAAGANVPAIVAILGLGILLLVLLSLFVERRAPAPVEEVPPVEAPVFEPAPAAPPMIVEVPTATAALAPPAPAAPTPGPAPLAPLPPPPAPRPAPVPPPATIETPVPGVKATVEILPGPAPMPKCPNCGEELDPDWIICPFCDAALR